MHSLRRIWHWVRSQNKTLFSTRFLFQWQFFSSYLNSSCNMISQNVDHFLNSWRFIMRETGKVSQIILNYQERILHLSNFFSKPDILPWKIEGTWGIFLVLCPLWRNAGKQSVPEFQGGLRNIQTTDFQFVSRKWWKPLLWDFLSFWGSRDEKAGPVLFVFEEGL